MQNTHPNSHTQVTHKLIILVQVRVNNLQELVYKQGQAGVTKASVSIVFNNDDKKASPVGYEQYNKITVTRQVFLY
jgi:structural maintenance of chromosome 2